jgi:hypothetical protein
MSNPTFAENLKLFFDGIACKNEKPISCYSGAAPGAVIMGMTVAEFVADPIKGAKAAIKMLERLQEQAGPLRILNSSAASLNMVVAITTIWNSRVLIPGKDLPENSFWQVQEKQLVDASVYDEILKGGYTNFVNSKILPRIIDMEYFMKYIKIAGEGGPEIGQAYAELGIPFLYSGQLQSTMVPFEQLCGMRSMGQFYMDCYKMPEKIKEVSDFIFAEKSAQTEIELEKVKDDPTVLASWVGGWRTASALVNRKIWDNLVWPYMKPAAEQLLKYGKIPIFHLDQNWDRDIERFGELPAGKIILNTDGMTNLPKTRKALPGYALMGDVPPTLLTTGTPQQVSDYVRKLIDEVGPQGLFVCPGCDTPVSAKFENLVAMVKTTNEWR